MLKNLYGWAAGIVILVPLAMVLVPLVYSAALLLAVALPLAFVISTVDDAWHSREPPSVKEALPKLLLAVVVAPAAILALATPLRAVTLASLSFLPQWMGKFDEMHEFLYRPFAPVFGHLSPYWIDMWWGVLGMGAIFLIALGDSIRRNRLGRQIEILPTSTVRAVAMGLVELKGRAVPLRRESTEPIIREWHESTGGGHGSHKHAEPFLIDDGTGRILVDPRGVTIQGERYFFSVGMHQAILEEFDSGAGFPESRLMPGDTVYVVGNVQTNPDNEYARYGEIVVKPKKSSLFSMNFYDIFFISNISEEALLAGFRKSVKRGWVKVVIAMAFAAWLSIFALTNLLQIESIDLDAAPKYLRLITTPTTLEREIRVPGVDKGPTLKFVRMLEQGDREKTDAIMHRFRQFNIVRLALPVLRAQAVNIDHPGFGAANHWLSRLDERPPQLWGGVFFEEPFMEANEHHVQRLSTRFHDNRLFVTYRAFVGNRKASERHEFKGRYVVIELVSKDTGEKFEAAFEANVGFNRADDVEAFEFLHPGEYEIVAYVRTSYRGGIDYRGFRTRKPIDIRLEE